jgi:hypothetical protein
MDVDARLRSPPGPHADARLRADARGRDGGVCQELAAGIGRSLIKRADRSRCAYAAVTSRLRFFTATLTVVQKMQPAQWLTRVAGNRTAGWGVPATGRGQS